MMKNSMPPWGRCILGELGEGVNPDPAGYIIRGEGIFLEEK